MSRNQIAPMSKDGMLTSGWPVLPYGREALGGSEVMGFLYTGRRQAIDIPASAIPQACGKASGTAVNYV